MLLQSTRGTAHGGLGYREATVLRTVCSSTSPTSCSGLAAAMTDLEKFTLCALVTFIVVGTCFLIGVMIG